jgi:hypothetical protein
VLGVVLGDAVLGVDVLLWASVLLVGGCELLGLWLPVADCAVAPVCVLVPALWLVVLSAVELDDCGMVSLLAGGLVALLAGGFVELVIVPFAAEPPAPLTVRCSLTFFTPGTLFAMSFALLRSALFGTEPLSVARPFETVTFTFAKSGFDAS